MRERIVLTIWLLFRLVKVGKLQRTKSNVADCVSKQRAIGPCPCLSNADEKERRLEQKNKSEEEGKSRPGLRQVPADSVLQKHLYQASKPWTGTNYKTCFKLMYLEKAVLPFP